MEKPPTANIEDPIEYLPLEINGRTVDIHNCVAELKQGSRDFEQIAADIFEYCMILMEIPEEYWKDNRHGENAKQDLTGELQKKYPSATYFLSLYPRPEEVLPFISV